MKKYLLILIALLIFIPSLPQIFHKNQGASESIGTVGKGSLVNGYKLPYKGDNFKYFSLVDYYLLGRCYVHSDIYKIVIESYKELEKDYPDYTFRLMECSKRKGGRPFPHKTHQNGTSIDFMTPLKKGNKTIKRYDKTGMWRYIMKFNEHGESRINKNIVIDFDKTTKHILVLEKIARQYGYKIKKVILETNLKDEIYASKYGSELKNSGIYFVKSLPKRIDELHDDHYHIDFEKM
jgi:penicillin-insensitive murein endopeptidase